jgi:tetratricopeptide (TPR) repeat protein
MAWLNEATSLLKLDRCTEALDHLHASLDKANDQIDLLAKIASIYADTLFQHDKALQYYRQCQQLQPDNALVVCNLAECQVIMGNYAQGRAEAERAFGNIGAEEECALNLIVFASYALEGNAEGRARQFDQIQQRLRLGSAKENAGDQEEIWSFNGLMHKVRTSNVPEETKFLILTVIDLHQGQLKISNLSFFAAAQPQPVSGCEVSAAAS